MAVAPGWENMLSMNQSIAQGVPETSGNSMAYFMSPNSFQNSQMNLISNTANTDLSEVPLLPEWNMRWSPQFINQEHNAISAGGMNDGSGINSFENPWSSKNPTAARNFAGDSRMSRQGGESTFAPFNRPQVNADIVGPPLPFGPRDTATVHTQNNVNFNTVQRGVQGKVEGSFLSLGIGGNEETVTRSHMGNREISDALREAASAELKIARARRAMGQTLDAGFMGLQRNISGFSNQSCHVDRMTSTNNEVGVQCTLNSGPGSRPYHSLQMQQSDMQHGISRHDDGNSIFLSSRNMRYGDLDHYRAFAGNQAAHSGTLGGNSAQVYTSQQYDLNGLAPESSKPSWITSHTPGQLQNIRFRTVNSLPSERSTNSPSLGLGSSSSQQNYAGQQVLSHNGVSNQGLGGSLFPQRIAAPQVAWVGSGQASTDAPFPKGWELSLMGKIVFKLLRDIIYLTGEQTCRQLVQVRHVNFQKKDPLTYQIIFFDVLLSDGTPVNYPLNSQEPFLAHGQSQDSLIQLSKDPRAATSINASTVDGLSQKSDFHVRPSHKRTAVAQPPPASHWVQRQKITHHLAVHHSVPNPNPFPTKPAVPVTSGLVHHPSIHQSHHGENLPSIPGTSHFKSRVPVKTAPIVAHIAWKDPDGTPQLTGHKCLLCKRDLSLTSEGAVYQPVPPPPVAVLPCGHTFHDQCLQNITPQDQSKDPPCIPCAIGDI
ncbi:hypothetical protein OSB04_004657 [Centaurea solstitialis]|uniref:RING-type domain-containing protein n=1 Tax=Centaurea solstitialis TaxID=347529 RepID=A0AA38TXJ1_9ASTR|nr:hypothetical protein OSB04_004657 [Centaurea solstitialis]